VTAIVVGGGGRGSSTTSAGGGGSGGDFRIDTSMSVAAETLTITVGAAGSGGTTTGGSGGFSRIARGGTILLEAAGGGGGTEAAPGAQNGTSTTISGTIAGGNGGSGASGSGTATAGGGGGAGGWSGNGGAGGLGAVSGGNGAGGAGGGGRGNVSVLTGGGGGGVGIVSTGSNGTGATVNGKQGSGGSGGSGGAVSAVGGTYGGGGAGDDTGTTAGNGGPGVVKIRYLTADYGNCTGGTETIDGLYTVNTFTSSGVFTAVPLSGAGPAPALGVNTRALTGLTPNTLYYYRGYADNATGRGWSEESTFRAVATTVSVTASTPISGVSVGASIPFVFTPTTSSGGTECQVLDNASTALTAYGTTTYNASTNAPGSYGYYIKCRNVSEPAIMATSNAITVTTVCPVNTTWNGTSCLGPSAVIFTASSCSIDTGENSCLSALNWTLANQIGDYAVTTPTSITIASGPGPTGSSSYSVIKGSRTFYLYNNTYELANATAVADCTAGVNAWNGIFCMGPTGTVTGAGCTIPLNGTSCDTTISWNTDLPLPGYTSVFKNDTDNTTINTANSGSYLATIKPALPATNNKTFSLYHNGSLLNSLSPIAACVANTSWNSTLQQCTEGIIIDPGNTVFTVNDQSTSATIFKGRYATIHWDSPAATSCTGTNFSTGVGSPVTGSLVVSPQATTIYTLSCTNAVSTTSFPVTTKVITLEIKEN
jgi:hypothetical protein